MNQTEKNALRAKTLDSLVPALENSGDVAPITGGMSVIMDNGIVLVISATIKGDSFDVQAERADFIRKATEKAQKAAEKAAKAS